MARPRKVYVCWHNWKLPLSYARTQTEAVRKCRAGDIIVDRLADLRDCPLFTKNNLAVLYAEVTRTELRPFWTREQALYMAWNAVAALYAGVNFPSRDFPAIPYEKNFRKKLAEQQKADRVRKHGHSPNKGKFLFPATDDNPCTYNSRHWRAYNVLIAYARRGIVYEEWIVRGGSKDTMRRFRERNQIRIEDNANTDIPRLEGPKRR